MKLVFEAAQKIQDFFDKNNWQFCFIGGIALQRWANHAEILTKLENLRKET